MDPGGNEGNAIWELIYKEDLFGNFPNPFPTPLKYQFVRAIVLIFILVITFIIYI